MAFFNVEMQFHAAPAKAFIQQMRECRSLTEVPFPATLAGKGFGEVRQVWRFVRGDDFRFHALAIMGEKGLGYGLANLLMGNFRQQFGEVGHAGTYRRNAFRRQFLFIRIEIVCQAAKVGIEQQGAVVEATIFGFAIGRA